MGPFQRRVASRVSVGASGEERCRVVCCAAPRRGAQGAADTRQLLPIMAQLYSDLEPKTEYYDKKSGMSKTKWQEALKVTRTLYVGNLSFYSTEEQILELFSKCGAVKKIVMGLNRFKKSPCGFCFVEYSTHEQAEQAMNLLNNTVFDERTIRVDWDAGVSEGRQFGRGESGDQWRDDFREDFDSARGGQGRSLLRRLVEEPGKQVYVGKRKHDHGNWEEGQKTAGKRPRGAAGKGGGGGGGGPEGPPTKKDDSAIPTSFGRQR